MLLWTFQANYSNKLNSLLPFGDTLKITILSLNRPFPHQMLGGSCRLSADSARAVIHGFRHLDTAGGKKT